MTRIDLGLIANNALFPAVGYGLLYALGLARLRWADVRLLGLSYLAGWALLGSTLSLALMAGVDVGLTAILLIGALLVAGCVLAGRRWRQAVPDQAGPRSHPLGLLAAAAGGAILLAAAAAAIVESLSEWGPELDALTFWGPRAETIYYWHGLHPAGWANFVHQEYPPLAPAMNAVTFQFVGGVHPSLLPFQLTLLGIAFLLAVLGLLDRFVPLWVSLPPLALLATAPWFWWRLQSILPDQTLAYLLATAALSCVLWLNDRRRAWLGLAVVFLAAASLTKLEGSFFELLLVGVTLAAGFAIERRAAWPALVLVLGPAAILPWHLWLTHHGLQAAAEDYRATALLDPGFLEARTGRLSYALHALVSGWHETSTGVTIGLFAVVLLAVAWRLPVTAAAVGAWLGLSFFGLASIYWIGRHEIHDYVSTSASRVGAVIIIAAAAQTPLLLGLALGRGAGGSGSPPDEADPAASELGAPG